MLKLFRMLRPYRWLIAGIFTLLTAQSLGNLYLPELNAQPGGARAQAERIAVNTPIQGTAADLIKLAMIRLDGVLRERGLATRMILQVHDELLLEAPKDEWREAAELAKREMEGVAELKIPLKVELKSGPNWAEMIGAA